MTAAPTAAAMVVDGLDVSVYSMPTDGPGGRESDGTLRWDSTTCVVVEAHAGGRAGIGYTYGPAAVATFVDQELAALVRGADAMKVPFLWAQMQGHIRNAGRPGVGAMAVSAVDNALWDLAARLMDVPLVTLLGQTRDHADIYGSGGFCNYDRARLQRQLGGWAELGIPRMKIKVGRHPDQDRRRVAWAREAIGDELELMVDANGAYRRSQARQWALWFAEQGIVWLEEPLSGDDVRGLSDLRAQGAPGLAIAAGEYGWGLDDFQRLLDHDAVDVLQADVTRCGGYTAFRRVDALCQAHHLPLSAHCAPAQSMHAVCACDSALHLEYFHDHARLESMLFDGTPSPEGGRLAPDLSRTGNGLELRRTDAKELAL